MITEVFLPQLTSTMEEGLVVNWLKAEGEAVEAGEPLVQVETDKAIMEIESPATGVLLKVLAQVGDACPVLAPLGLIGSPDDDVSAYRPAASRADAAPPGALPLPPPPLVAAAGGAGAFRPTASPRARRLAEELGVDLATVGGSGPGGRITEQDVRQAATAPHETRPPVGPVVPFAGMRKAVATWMTKSKQEIPHFYLTSRLDLAAAAQLLADLKPRFAAEGVKLTYTAVLAKATALALRATPQLNAWCTGEGVQLLPEVNLGVAIAAREGIVVPVLAKAPERELLDLARALQDLAARARSGALSAEAFLDRSFTLSNLGGFPVDQFAAIINPPEVGILAVGRVQDAVGVQGGEIVVRPQLTVTLSCDHRAVDGVIGARFLQHLGDILREPQTLV